MYVYVCSRARARAYYHEMRMRLGELEMSETTSKPFHVLLRQQVLQTGLRAVLVIVNIIVSLLCLAVFVTGLWGRLHEDSYVGITEEPSLRRTAMAVAVVGLCALLLSLVGVVGALLLKSILGQVVLSVYAFVLAFLVVVEVGAGAAAIQSRDDLRGCITNHTLSSLMSYNDSESVRHEWDQFQRIHECCGAVNYSDYFQVFDDNVVPESCCTAEAKKDGTCSHSRIFVTPSDGDIYTRPCLNVVVSRLQETLLVLAVIAIVVGISQISGVVMSVIMIFAKERKTQSYHKLKHQPGSLGHYST